MSNIQFQIIRGERKGFDMVKKRRSWEEIFKDLRQTAVSKKDAKKLSNLRTGISLFIEIDESMTMHEVIDKFEAHVKENIQQFEELRNLLA